MTQKVTESPIDEIHRIRREISDRFGGDIVAIAEDAARRQAESNRPVWQPNTTNQAMHASGNDVRAAVRD
jgi:hypothetical protein